MNYGKNMLIMVVALALVIALALGVGPVFAVDDTGIFELEYGTGEPGAANAMDNDLPGDDWQTLYTDTTEPYGASAYFTGVTPDPPPKDIFVGGRKDIQDIPEWGWKEGSVPDKDDITNAYAAAYVCPASNGCTEGDLIIYFGADRFANKGDAFMGFWFFQGQVAALPGGGFSGEHQDGDVLVLANFPQGTNEVPEINVVVWDPEHDYPGGTPIAKNLSLIAAGKVCDGLGGDACANTNDGDRTSPWSYTPKSGTSDVFPYESFFEGGVNITRILGRTPCFGSFMAETRSSKRFTATLKDFVLEPFELCEISVQKECDVVQLTTDEDPTDKLFVVDFEGFVENTGIGYFPAGETLTVVDDAGTPGDDTDDVQIEIDLIADFNPGDQIPFSGSFFSDDNPPYNTVTASITFGEASIPADPFSIECEPLILNPGLTLTKSCWTELETVGDYLVVKVNIDGDVCNTGDVPLTVDVDDTVLGTIFDDLYLDKAVDELTPTCQPFSDSYYPSQAEGGETCAGDAYFSDQVSASGTHPALPGPVNAIPQTANCDLCFECPE